MNEGSSAGKACSAMASGVQPSARCKLRIGRGELKRYTSFIRVPKTWPVTPRAASEARNTAIGAFLSGVICWILATRARSSSVRAGIDWVMRLHAQGDRQFERTLNRFMSIAIALDRAVIPSLAEA